MKIRFRLAKKKKKQKVILSFPISQIIVVFDLSSVCNTNTIQISNILFSWSRVPNEVEEIKCKMERKKNGPTIIIKSLFMYAFVPCQAKHSPARDLLYVSSVLLCVHVKLLVAWMLDMWSLNAVCIYCVCVYLC